MLDGEDFGSQILDGRGIESVYRTAVGEKRERTVGKTTILCGLWGCRY